MGPVSYSVCDRCRKRYDNIDECKYTGCHIENFYTHDIGNGDHVCTPCRADLFRHIEKAYKEWVNKGEATHGP
jgi:hypothetical protein